jgi:hypothetical protein
MSGRPGPGPNSNQVTAGNGRPRHNRPMHPDQPTFEYGSATPADHPRRGPLDDLRQRLARLSASHPSSPGFETRGDGSGGGEAAKERAGGGEAAQEPAGGGEAAQEPAEGGEGAGGGEGAREPPASGGQAGEGGRDLTDALGRLDRLSRLVGGGGRAGSDRPATGGRGEGVLPGSGTRDPYRPWFAPGEVCQPWFSPDQSDRSG